MEEPQSGAQANATEPAYGLASIPAAGHIAAPLLDFRPPRPAGPELLPIGLIGCGGISQSHLQAYRNGGFRVTALCDHTHAKAEARRKEFYPEAVVVDEAIDLLRRDDVAVVDLTTHPRSRPALIEAALRAGKHVLSQKPFVEELETGRRLVELADGLGRKLAVNQNGRWAPHFAYIREAIRAGLIGEVASVDFHLQWDHHWIVGTAFEDLPHLVLSDFAIHWFDLVTLFFSGRRARRVYAAAAHAPGQRARPPFLAHAAVELERGQATLSFHAGCVFGQEDRTSVAGSLGTIRSIGPSLTEQQVRLHTAAGVATPALEGSWFPDGFQGAMGELLCAIEQDRAPLNSARENLQSLALAFAALRSAECGRAVDLPS
jgi:predicted dehydrogenase